MSGGEYFIMWFAWGIALSCATASATLRNLSWSRLTERCRAAGRDSYVQHILAQQEPLGAALDLNALIAVLIGGGIMVRAFHHDLGGMFSESPWPGIAILVSAAFSVLYWIPTLLQRFLGEGFLLSTWPVWAFFGRLVWPVFWFGGRLFAWSKRPDEADAGEEAEDNLAEEIRGLVSAGQREGLIENDEREMIESVMELADAVVAQIMTPRTEMVSVRGDVDWNELVRFAGESGHSRIPVHGKSRDEIIGILIIKDLFRELAKPESQRRLLRTIVRRPFFVPESKPVNEMLQEFQRGRTHIAIVLDEYGGVSGLVTIEDVLEEIVGEIADEHDDAATDEIKQLDETTFETHGRVHIADFNERLGIHLPDEETFDTLGGYVFHELGRIPAVGETFERGRVRIKILDANRRRIDRLSIELLPENVPAAEAVESPHEAKSQAAIAEEPKPGEA